MQNNLLGMRRLDDTGQHYIPLRLPCGKEINQHYAPGKTLQCCRTECGEKKDENGKIVGKSNAAIEECYRRHKQQLIAERDGKSEETSGIKKGRKRRVVEKKEGAA